MNLLELFTQTFHTEWFVNLIYAASVPTLLMLAWFMIIRFYHTRRVEFIILSIMFVVHTVGIAVFSVHRYIHIPEVRATYRALGLIVLLIIWAYFYRYRYVFIGRRKPYPHMHDENGNGFQLKVTHPTIKTTELRSDNNV